MASPETKAKKPWNLQYARAVWYAGNHLPEGAIGYRSRELYKKIKRYAHGKQDWRDYLINAGLMGKDDTNIISFLQRRIVNLGPKHRFIGIGLLTKQGRKISINAIDPQAPNELAKKQAERKARLMQRKTLMEMGMSDLAQHPMVAQRPREPDDEEGLDIMAMGERLPICADALDIVRAIYNNNNYEAIRYQWDASLFDYGAAVVKDDAEGDNVTLRVCELADMVLPYSRYWDFRDMTYAGEVRTIPVSALVAMSDGQLKKEEIQTLYENGNSLDSDWYSKGDYGNFDEWYGRATVSVLDLEMLSTDTKKALEWRDGRGNLQYRDAKGERKKDWKEEKAVHIQNVYRVKWVIGTDICFDYGRQFNIKRDSKNEAKARLSYHVVAGSIDEMAPYSRMEAMMDLIDEYVTLTVKLRDALYKVIGSSYDINLDALEDVDLGNGKQKLTPQDNLTNWIRNKVILSRSRSVNGQIKSEKPAITFLQAGIGNEIAEFANRRREIKQELNEVIGYNPAVDATSIDPKTLNGANMAMMQGTNNALTDLFFADKQLMKATAESVLIRAQDLIRAGRGKALMSIVGADSVRRIGDAPALDKYNFGIVIEDEPTPEEMADFRGALNLAIERQQINVADRFTALNMAENNLMQAQQFLTHAVQKAERLAHERALALSQQNAQVQQQSVQVAAQMEQQTIQVKLQADSQLSAQNHAQKMEQIREQGAISLEEERIGGTARTESATIQAEAREYANVRDNTAKLLKEGMDDKTGSVNQPADLRSKIAPLTDEDNPLPKPSFSFLPQKQPMPEMMPEDMMGMEDGLVG